MSETEEEDSLIKHEATNKKYRIYKETFKCFGAKIRLGQIAQI